MANTLLLSESIEANNRWCDIDEEWRAGFVFFPPDAAGQAPLPDVHRINGPGPSADAHDRARPSSFHRGGVQAVFCDGHVRFLRDNIDYRLYVALMTPNGGMAVEPGTNTPSPTVRQQPKITADAF